MAQKLLKEMTIWKTRLLNFMKSNSNGLNQKEPSHTETKTKRLQFFTPLKKKEGSGTKHTTGKKPGKLKKYGGICKWDFRAGNKSLKNCHRAATKQTKEGKGPTLSEFLPCQPCPTPPHAPLVLRFSGTPSTAPPINITISGSIVRHIGWQPRIACKWNRSHKDQGNTFKKFKYLFKYLNIKIDNI